MMRKQDALRFLETHKQEMQERFAVKRLALFGSTARDDARVDSDVDVLVEFDGQATFDRFMGLQIYLENGLGAAIDLATPASIRPRMRPYIEKDLVYVP